MYSSQTVGVHGGGRHGYDDYEYHGEHSCNPRCRYMYGNCKFRNHVHVSYEYQILVGLYPVEVHLHRYKLVYVVLIQ